MKIFHRLNNAGNEAKPQPVGVDALGLNGVKVVPYNLESKPHECFAKIYLAGHQVSIACGSIMFGLTFAQAEELQAELGKLVDKALHQ